MSRAFALAARALAGLGETRRGRRERRGSGAKKELDRVLRGLRGPDAPRASELVYGVVRRRRTLHALLGAVARRALKGRSEELAHALELGSYALSFQEGEHAANAVRDALSLASGKKARARVERVLRALEAALSPGLVPWAEVGEEEKREGRVLPVKRGFARRLVGTEMEVRGASAARRLALIHSYPDELVSSWLEAYGEERAEDLAWAGNDPPPLFGRANALRSSPGELVALLAKEGVIALERPDLGPKVIELGEGRGSFRETRAFRSGRFVIQDATAQEPAPLLAPREGERVLDLCAAPGGKTTHLAELSRDRARIVACDVSPRRLLKVTEAARRLGLSSIETREVDASRDDALARETFDAVLVDAPCSNTGVIRRRPEARWRYRPAGQRKLVRLQERILATGLRALSPGGRLVYSVCSIEPEEGPDLVRRVIEGSARVVEREVVRFPSPGGGDGGYAALVSRGGT